MSLKIGLIGAGANTKLRHIPGFKAIRDVEIVTVCNRSKESSQAVADEFGIERISYNWQEVCEDPAVDAICIGTWPYLHAEATLKALKNGKHVLTEARMARNVAEARTMLEASLEHPDLVCQIVPSPFTLEYDEIVQSLISNGVLGDLREIFFTHTTSANANASNPLTWRQDYMYSGCNMLTLGIYYEILLRWLHMNPEWIVADGGVFTPERKHWENAETVQVEIPDSISLLGRLENGTRLAGRFSSVEAGASANEIRINGSDACLRVNVATGELTVTGVYNGKEQQLDYEKKPDGGWQVEQDFIESIRTGKKVELTSFKTGVCYMNFTEMVWRSWMHHGKRFDWVQPFV